MRHARIDPSDFNRLCEEAKQGRNLSDILARHTKLTKRGRIEKKGLCPFHAEKTPSFEVNDAKGRFYCHGCGARGDHFRALMVLDGLTFRQAFEALTNDTFPTVDPTEQAKRAVEDATERQAAIEEARFFWRSAHPIEGTQAETYLRECRGLSAPVPPCFRFSYVPSRKDDAGLWGPAYPALLGAVGLGDDLVAIQRIFLLDDGTDKRWGKKSKLTLGRFRCGAIRMNRRHAEPTEIIVTEGPEDALTLAQELPDVEVWSALGTSNMPLLQLPGSIRRVTIAGQNDPAGRAAAAQAAIALAQRDLEVRTMWPAEGYKDWNNQLRGVRG